MKIKETRGEKIFNVFNVTFMVLFMIVSLYPILYVVFASFSDPVQFMTSYGGMLFGPKGFSIAPYQFVFKNPNIWIGYQNTILIVVVGTACNILMTVLGAYFLSRQDVMWKRAITLLILFTMYFSGGMIPNYLNVQSFGLIDNRAVLIIPGLISTYNMIIMRTAFTGVPESLEESAKLDGANHFTILFRIMIPLCMPTIAVLVLYYGVEHWNSWFQAMIYMRTRSKFPLQLFLREILIQNDISNLEGGYDDREMIGQTMRYATIVVATVPILCLYPFLQKYFVKGVMVGAVKG